MIVFWKRGEMGAYIREVWVPGKRWYQPSHPKYELYVNGLGSMPDWLFDKAYHLKDRAAQVPVIKKDPRS